MRWAAAAVVVVVGCSFEHGAATAPDAAADGPCTRTSGTPWWRSSYPYRYRIDTGGAPTGYTISVDDTPLSLYFGGEGYVSVRVVVDHATEVDRVFSGGRMYVQVPAEGELWAYAGGDSLDQVHEDPGHVFTFAESFGNELPLTRFDLQPVQDWSVVTIDYGLYIEQVLRVTGPGRHPGLIKNLTMKDGVVSASVRFLAGTGQQHNGIAARSKDMSPDGMDGFVGQLQADIQHARIAEYTNGVSPPAELSIMDRAIARNRWYRLEMRFVGDTITLSINGTVALTTTKSGSDGELLGIFAHDCDVEFDSIWVRPAMDPEPMATLGPMESYCD